MLNRRAFLATALAASTVAAAHNDSRLESLTDWLAASPDTRERALARCLNRIKQMEPSIHAWVQVSLQKPTGHGKLYGIPFGVKDIVETRGLLTEYGSPIYQGRIGTADAAIVRELRSRGAILLGKTQTTAFAYRTPAPTRNPRNLDHTPGGSSSGSAAAVAAGMVPFTVGEQTLGSILRPASYCGVTGFKPTYGLLDTEGMLQLAKSLDTLGFFTNTPDDMLALWGALGRPLGAEQEFPLAVCDPLPEIEPAMTAAFQGAVSRLRESGVSLRSVDIGDILKRLADAAQTVMFYEGARFHEDRFKQYGDRLADLATLVREGLKIPAERYDESKRYISESGNRIDEIYQSTPVILVPAATGPAPLGLSFTGDTRMNAPWTALGVPAISIPMPVGNGLPLGLQLTAQRGEDARLLRTAVRIQRVLGSSAA
jgi:Asp-tRNA(Asn)/Glu-tRNA(Gln) amidotransferase A subunit family amidase